VFVSLYVVIIVWIERSPTPNVSDICLRICLAEMLGSFMMMVLYIFIIRILTSSFKKKYKYKYLKKISLNKNAVLEEVFKIENQILFYLNTFNI